MKKQRYFRTTLFILGSCFLTAGMGLAHAKGVVSSIQNKNTAIQQQSEKLLRSVETLLNHLQKAAVEISQLEAQNSQLSSGVSSLPSKCLLRAVK